MEFNQENRSFCMPLAVLDTVAEQLTDIDLTLPDYCPDIEKILKCTLIPKIQSKSLSGGQLQIDGYCVVNVLYVESIKNTVRCCEQSVNFSQTFSLKETLDNPVIITKTKPEYINCRALSPRRLVMHGAFSLYAKVYTTSKTKFYCPDKSKLETLKRSVRCADLVTICQEQFNICEELSVADKPAIETILHSVVGVSITDSKAVSGKLMLNGEINLRMLYLCDVETGETKKLDYILPFNQVLDCEGINENTINSVSCEVMSCDIRLKNDMLSEKPAIILDAKLSVTEQGYEINDEDLVMDAYSVSYASKPKFEQLKITGDLVPVSEIYMQKTNIKVDDCKISKVIDIYADSITANLLPNSDSLAVGGKINICMLAVNQDGVPVFVERTCEYEHKITSATDCNSLIETEAKAVSISYRLSDDNTVEIRCEIKITAQASKNEVMTVVSDVEIFSDKAVATDDCALTLYFAKEGESLWNIAKSHNTRLDMLINENSAESQILDSPKMLLIPKV